MEFNLSNNQLLDIAYDFSKKVDIGLKFDNTEIKALPTYIHPQKEGIKGEALVLDLGGTNFRAAIVSVRGGDTTVKEIVEKDITEMKTPGFSQKRLFESQLDLINQLKDIPKGLPIGYCFSYPAKSLKNGDSELLKWVKGVNIANMEGKPVGKPLLDYLNKNSDYGFTKITVVNDTITSLFSGLKNTGFDAYIGLIVGTGTNMATFFHSQDIPKIDTGWEGTTPVNLESGNFFPPHLSSYDDIVDINSDSQGIQRFEKAVSGMYLGHIFKTFIHDKQLPEDFDAANLTYMINHPEHYKKKYVDTAFKVYERSAKLVAASLAGLINKLVEVNPHIIKVQVLAEGGLFWNNLTAENTSYSSIVEKFLNGLLKELDLEKIKVTISKIDNANLIGAAIAVLSKLD